MSETRFCGYCGAPATTNDHVVADCLLVDRSTKVLIPACQPCNNQKSREDEYLRDVFAMRLETSEFMELCGKREKMVASALRIDRIGPAKTILSTIKKVPRLIPNTWVMLWVPAVEARAERIFAGLQWIVRGLHYHHLNRIMPVNLEWQWFAYEGNENRERFDQIWHQSESNRPFRIGDCLTYKVGVVEEVPNFSNWLLVFYDRLFFILTVNESELMSFGEPSSGVSNTNNT